MLVHANMGQNSSRRAGNSARRNCQQILQNFPDIRNFPPEISVSILEKLNATDLCLAACVWSDLAADDILWKRLCHERWRYVSVYQDMGISDIFAKRMSYRELYLLLDEATLFFSYNPHQAISYLIENNVMVDDAVEIAKLFNNTKTFYSQSMHTFLSKRPDVLTELVNLQEYSEIFLSVALRQFFKKVSPPEQNREFLEALINVFSRRYSECNQHLSYNKESIAVLCYSLLLLSVDLYSPHVKNKMSKREFIRNNLQIVPDANRDLLGDLYDDVYLNGHIAATSMNVNFKLQQPFRPYGVLFELKSWKVQSCC